LHFASGHLEMTLRFAAAEGINLSANTINVLAPKTPSKEITPSQGIEGNPIYEVIERHRSRSLHRRDGHRWRQSRRRGFHIFLGAASF
jgi:hypothetical protein